MLHFSQPLWIAAGVFSCVLAWVLLRFLEQRRTRQLHRFAAAPLTSGLTLHLSRSKRRLKNCLLLAAILLCFIALARPQYGQRWVDVKHKGIDILFALDTSKSMLAEDVRPNRLERSKLAIMDFVSGLSGDRVGLLPFAGSSFLVCPLTADYQAFEQTLMSIDQTTIPDGGTDIGAAIDTALETLTNEANHKLLVVVTDGEELQGNVLAAARRAAENGMVVHAVGVGTHKGELIPDPVSGGFVQDRSGRFVRSRLDRASLDAIAQKTGGLSVLLGSQGQGLETIYREKLALVPPTELAEKRKQVPIERFGWPLAAAIVLLALELIMSPRKNESAAGNLSRRLAGFFANAKQTFSITLVVLAALAADPAILHSSEAEELYARLDYRAADSYYRELLEEQPDNPLLLFNSGTTAYKSKQFEEAIRAFDRALATDDLQLQEKSYFNRGNGFYRLGELSLDNQEQIDLTIGSWERAVSSYEQALALNPENALARANHAFVTEKLERLRQEQQKPQRTDRKPFSKKREHSSGAGHKRSGAAKQTGAAGPAIRTGQDPAGQPGLSGPSGRPAAERSTDAGARIESSGADGSFSKRER